MSDWEYGEAYKRHPITTGIAVFDNGSSLKTHDIFNKLPDFMCSADLLFVDPPWNKGNLTSFYTKNDSYCDFDYEAFTGRLFECIKEIKPQTCYIEIGKEHLADFIIRMQQIYKNVTFYNSSYYHKKNNICYVIRGGQKRGKIPLDYLDEEDIISKIAAEEEYTCIGDLCMGRGLVALAAQTNNKKFVGTELNHKRLSVALERLSVKTKYYIAGREVNE